MNDPKAQAALDARARRAARRVGLYARKWRSRVGTPENDGGFMLVDPATRVPVAGFRYDLDAQGVLDYARESEGREAA